MVDDLTLERLLGDAADAITVPPDGPERVLAARGATAPVRPHLSRRCLEWLRRRPLRTAAVLVASTVAVGLVAGVASNSGGSGPSGSAAHTAGIGERSPATQNSQQGTSSAASGAALPSPALPSGAAQPSTPNLVPSSSQAKVVKTGSMTLQVASVEPAIDRMTFLAGSVGGYVASSTTNVPGAGQPSSGDITLRVPEASFESFVSQVRLLGKPSQVTVSGRDVTSQYADLKARLQALQSTINQLQLIETKAQTIGDVLAVEQQISAEQTQADQIQGQINVLDDQTTYASLSVHAVEQQKKSAAAPPPPSGISKAWDHARHSFSHGVESVIGALGGIAVFLLFAGLLVGLARIGWLALRRRLV